MTTDGVLSGAQAHRVSAELFCQALSRFVAPYFALRQYKPTPPMMVVRLETHR
jgi:hypothetical protein